MKEGILVIILAWVGFLAPFSSPRILLAAAERQVKTIEPISDSSKKWLEEVAPYIITDTEKAFFMSADKSEKISRSALEITYGLKIVIQRLVRNSSFYYDSKARTKQKKIAGRTAPRKLN